MDRAHLISNMVRYLSGAKKKIQKRQTAIFYRVDPNYGSHVAKCLVLNIDEIN